MGMKPGPSLALKAKVVCLDENDEVEVCPHNMTPDVLEDAYNDHVALSTTAFWKDPAKAKAYNDMKLNPSGKKEYAARSKTCYNCHNKNHFIRDYPCENREQHGGRLVQKDHAKLIQKKPVLKKKPFFKKAPRIVLVAQEEYPSEDSDEEGETTTEVAALAIASATSTSLFESPNENLFTNNARCLMAHATEVSPSNLKVTPEIDDQTSLVIKKELVAFDTFLANLQGETKKHVEALMRQVGIAECLLEEKAAIEREDADTIASLKTSVDTLTASLEEESEY